MIILNKFYLIFALLFTACNVPTEYLEETLSNKPKLNESDTKTEKLDEGAKKEEPTPVREMDSTIASEPVIKKLDEEPEVQPQEPVETPSLRTIPEKEEDSPAEEPIETETLEEVVNEPLENTPDDDQVDPKAKPVEEETPSTPPTLPEIILTEQVTMENVVTPTKRELGKCAQKFNVSEQNMVIIGGNHTHIKLNRQSVMVMKVDGNSIHGTFNFSSNSKNTLGKLCMIVGGNHIRVNVEVGLNMETLQLIVPVDVNDLEVNLNILAEQSLEYSGIEINDSNHVRINYLGEGDYRCPTSLILEGNDAFVNCI